MDARFLAAGDRALLVEFDAPASIAVNEQVRAIDFLISEQRIAGIVETVPAFRSLLVHYDPYLIAADRLVARISALLPQASPARLPRARTIELPCCYEDKTLGFELDAAAEHLRMSRAALMEHHASATYLVYFLGFAPGQPYMSALEAPITIPRLTVPRTKTPAGSVGIGGTQCCIYSVESPGGFWVLGRTPVPLYAPSAAQPILLKAGDHIRFRPIGRPEYDAIAAAVADQSYQPVVT
jgi:KipI family sensor histidine kinase inhibitor